MSHLVCRKQSLLRLAAMWLMTCTCGWTAVAAEIEVQRGGTVITDGGTDGTGTASAALLAYNLTYTVRNVAIAGADTLTVGAVSVSSPSNCAAEVLAQPVGAVTAGSATSFSLRITPAAAGPWSARISFTNSDANEGAFDYTVSGTAGAPVPEVGVRFGAALIASGSTAPVVTGTAKGIVRSLAYTIENLGAGALNVVVPIGIGATSNCSAIIAQQPAATIAGGASSDVGVQITPGQGAWSVVLQISNSDTDESFYSFTVAGTATGPEIAVNRGNASVNTGTGEWISSGSVANEPLSLLYGIANIGSGQLNIFRYPADSLPGQMQMAVVRSAAPEGGETTIRVKRIGGIRGIVSIDWYVDSLSAVVGQDLTNQSGTLTWQDGDNTDKAITVSTTWDDEPEGTEEFYIRLHNPQGGASMLSPFQTTVAIEDDDAATPGNTGGYMAVRSATRSMYVSESPSVKFFDFERTGSTAGVAVFRVTLEDGTAVKGQDYGVYALTPFGVGTRFLNAGHADWEVTSWNTDDSLAHWRADPANSGATGWYYLVWAADNDGNYNPSGAWSEGDGGWDAEVWSNGVDYMVYMAGNGLVQIPISILGDDIQEPIESIHVRISEQKGCNIGTETSSDHSYQYGSVFITDDDFSQQHSIITEQINCRATVTATPDRIVGAGASTQLPLSVVPDAAGAWQFTVTVVNDDANEADFTWLVAGNAGPDVPDIDLSRNGRSIPRAGIDSVSGLVAGSQSTLSYTIRNTGTDPLTLSPPASLVSLTNCAISDGTVGMNVLQPGQSTVLTVLVTPAGAGSWSASLTMTSDDPDEGSYDIALQGVATAAPAAEFQWYRIGSVDVPVAQLAIDNRSDLVCIQGVSYTVQYRIANIGSATMVLGLAGDAVTAATGFSVAPTAPATVPPSLTVDPNAATTVAFTFTPNAANWSFTYTLPTNDVDEASAGITISGMASPAAPDPAVYRDSALIPNGFDDAPTGLSSAEATVLTYAISNQGSQTLTLSPATLSLGSSSNCTASVVTQVAASVAPGASTTLQISVRPTVVGPYSFDVSIPSNASATAEAPIFWTVAAVAEQPPIVAPEIQVARNGTVLANDGVDAVEPIFAGTPMQLTYAIDNLGSDILTIGQPQISGVTNCSVRVVAAAASIVPATSGTSLLLAVTPTASGVGWAFTWTVATNDTSEAATRMTVTGTGLVGSYPEITVDRNLAAIDPVAGDAVGSTYLGIQTNLTYTVANPGGLDLILSPVAVVSAPVNCTVQITTALPVSLAHNGSAELGVQVIASASPWSFVLSIPSNDANETPFMFAVTGTATPAPVDIAISQGGAHIADGTTVTVDPASTSFTCTVANAGLGDLHPGAITFTSSSGLAAGPTVTTALPGAIASGASSPLVFSFTPGAGGWSFTAAIASDDADESPFEVTVVGPVVPEMAVTVGGISVADGASLGLATAGSSISCVVSNSGTGALSLGAVTFAAVSGLNASPTVTTAPAASVPVGGSTTLVIGVVPGAGPWSFSVSIVNDDADESPYDFTCAAGPDIAVSRSGAEVQTDATGLVSHSAPLDPASDTIQGTSVGVATDVIYAVRNAGIMPLEFPAAPSVAGTPVNCTVTILDGLPSSLAVSGSDDLMVRIVPLAGAATAGWSACISIPSNDNSGGESPFLLTMASENPASAAAGIRVTRNGTAVPSFGVDSVGGGMEDAPMSVSYIIQDVGLGNLTLGAPSLSGQSNCVVSVTNSPAANLSSGSTSGLVLRVVPQDPGPWSFLVGLPTNVSGATTMEWAVSGNATSFQMTPAALGLSGGGGCGAGLSGLLIIALGLIGLRQRRR